MRIGIDKRAAVGVVTALCMVLTSVVSPLHASAQEASSDPWRVVGLLSLGGPLRVTRRADLGQETFAPLFVDTGAALLWPGTGRLRHGPLLGLSTNLTIDGGFYDPVDRFAQWVVLAGYCARWPLNDDWLVVAHAGVPIDLGSSGSAGFELSAGLGYRLLAGFGGFAALSGDVFGGEGGVSVIASMELGLFVDYEVLP